MAISIMSNKFSTNTFLNVNNNDTNNKEKEVKSMTVEKKKNDNKIIQNFEKVKETLIKEKEKIQEQDISVEEKREKLAELNKKIAEVEAEIQQAKQLEEEKEKEKIKEKLEEQSEKNNEKFKDEERDGVIVAGSLKKLIAAKQKIDSVHNLKTTKANLKVELGYLKPTANENSFVNRQMAKLSKGIAGLENGVNHEIAKSFHDVNTIKEDERNNLHKEKAEKEEKVENK